MHAFSHHTPRLRYSGTSRDGVSNAVKGMTADVRQLENIPDVTCFMLCTLSMPRSAFLARQAGVESKHSGTGPWLGLSL